MRALTDHRVLVLEGPTGSGKTTQLPKILQRAMVTDQIIGITQPRRIAAVSVAWRVAAEMGVRCGDEVGYAIRFDDQTSAATRIKIMTDGILLQEARTDPDFSRYGVLVVDEAHERTLNIDVTLGLLHRALTRRPDLRVVVSSATLQPLLFQRYFQEATGLDVPIVSIDARPFPVEILFRPPDGGDSNEAVVEAAAAEILAIVNNPEPGHILTFLSGEAAIRQTYDKLALSKLPKNVLLLPLYGKLTRSEQERVFDEPAGMRKVILSTNIAETSITVPDVRYVIDSGLAKVPRFHARTHLQTLFEEGISKASADQRAGRAGRTAPGKCIRLYSKKSYSARPDFTDEEILRLDLSEVVLRLIDLGIKQVEDFPLPTPPRRKALEAAIRMLETMGAIDGERNLTRIGQRMMPFPLSPTLARMVVEAADKYPKVVEDVLMVAAFMSAHPPFLFPQGEEAEARAAQSRLQHPTGDAMTAVIALSRYLAARSQVGFCKEHYLDADVMAFIAKAYRQLRDIASGLGIVLDGGGEAASVVRSMAAGFGHQILRAHGRAYEGLNTDQPISVHPASALFGQRAPFIVAAEVVVSTRAYARFACALKPEWVAEANPELAREWGLSAKKKSEVAALAKASVPQTLTIGNVRVAVEDRRGKIAVVLPARDKARLEQADLRGIPPMAFSWKAEVVAPDGVIWGRPMSLAKWLCVLKHVPIPETAPTAIEARELPLGALLELDRNLHTLQRILPHILEPALVSKGRQAGWVALVSNGEGGFWVELVTDWGDALTTSVESLHDLRTALPQGDPLGDGLDERIDEMREREGSLRDAYAAAKRLGGKE
ncbi:MAG: ATP-dependent RNA helicase [Myxococcota bacterium]